MKCALSATFVPSVSLFVNKASKVTFVLQVTFFVGRLLLELLQDSLQVIDGVDLMLLKIALGFDHGESVLTAHVVLFRLRALHHLLVVCTCSHALVGQINHAILPLSYIACTVLLVTCLEARQHRGLNGPMMVALLGLIVVGQATLHSFLTASQDQSFVVHSI